jgi:CelD/BcsL family acetyltransferase involved in cellulose biosynthesis
MMLSLRTNIARSAAEMDRIAPLWDELLRWQTRTLFQTFAWNRLAAEMFADRASAHVVCAESDTGAAIIPACMNRVTGQMELLGDALFDYRDVLHIGDGEALRVAWQQVADCGKPLRVYGLDQSARERWTNFPTSLFANAPQVDRALIDESTFRLTHSRLGRQIRRLQNLGVSLHIHSGEDSTVVRHLYECKRTHFAADSENIFLDERRGEFMVAAAAMEAGRCEVFTLEQESGTMIAGLLTFCDRAIRRCYTTYFHPAWARYSPGVALLYEVTARSLGEGLSCDYMTGEYPYKMRLANGSRTLYKVQVSASDLAALTSGKISRAA